MIQKFVNERYVLIIWKNYFLETRYSSWATYNSNPQLLYDQHVYNAHEAGEYDLKYSLQHLFYINSSQIKVILVWS